MIEDLDKYEGLETRPAVDAAIARGEEVIYSTDKTLLCDLDTPEARKQFERVLPVVVRQFKVKSVERWFSKSGNVHALVTLEEPISSFESRIALQAALGSDGVKEVLSIARHAKEVVHPSVLFKPKNARPYDPQIEEIVDAFKEQEVKEQEANLAISDWQSMYRY